MLAHHLLHLFRPYRVLPGLHHLLMIRSHLMVVGSGLRDNDSGGCEGKHSREDNAFTGGKHGDLFESLPPIYSIMLTVIRAGDLLSRIAVSVRVRCPSTSSAASARYSASRVMPISAAMS